VICLFLVCLLLQTPISKTPRNTSTRAAWMPMTVLPIVHYYLGILYDLFVKICWLFTLVNMIVFWRKFFSQSIFRKVEWHPSHNQIYSRFWYAFSLFLGKSHSTNPFNGIFLRSGPSPVRWEIDGIFISACQQNVIYAIFSQIRTVFEPVLGPCTMNVRNEPAHDMACVVKRETPSVRRWKLCEFQHEKAYQFRE